MKLFRLFQTRIGYFKVSLGQRIFSELFLDSMEKVGESPIP